MKMIRIVIALFVAVLLTACGSLERKPAVPADLTTQAIVPGMPGVRYRVGIDTERLRKDAIDSFWREMAWLEKNGHTGPLPPVSFLVVSGGGDNGAFGAGLLTGWTKAGARPDFKLVTGVSTGALIAPFAFLGPSRDEQLRRLYTTLTPEDIVKPRSVLAALTADALADNSPLWQLVRREVDQDFLKAMAEEHEKGRILMLATADLDARQSVLWNMTKIAASSNPKALGLFHAIMVASAAIPGAFPPVMIDVEAGGKQYQEMHVDGGTMSQLFVYPAGLHTKEEMQKARVTRERRAYIIRNARLDPDWASVERQTVKIAGRAISSLIHTQGIGDLYKVYLITQRDGVDYNLAFIPPTFDTPHREEFDTEYMRSLFYTAHDAATAGYRWEKAPPGF